MDYITPAVILFAIAALMIADLGACLLTKGKWKCMACRLDGRL